MNLPHRGSSCRRAPVPDSRIVEARPCSWGLHPGRVRSTFRGHEIKEVFMVPRDFNCQLASTHPVITG